MEIRNVSNKMFKVMIIKMLTELGRGMNIVRTSTELENIRKNQSEVKYSVTKMKNIIEEIDSRLDDKEEQISNLENRIMEIIQSEDQKIKLKK